MRLIDADAFIAELTIDPIECPGCPEPEFLDEFLALVASAPTADAVPVVHGHWKEDPSEYGFWICSACGFVSEASAADMLYKFCPVCGARMDGKDET